MQGLTDSWVGGEATLGGVDASWRDGVKPPRVVVNILAVAATALGKCANFILKSTEGGLGRCKGGVGSKVVGGLVVSGCLDVTSNISKIKSEGDPLLISLTLVAQLIKIAKKDL